MKNQDRKKRLIQRWHILLNEVGIKEEGKMDLLASYNVVSSKELNVDQLAHLCDFLEGMRKSEDVELERRRKGLLATVCDRCELLGVKGWEGWSNDDRMRYAKAVVCRAAQVKSFNGISRNRLISLNMMFAKKNKEMEEVLIVAKEVMKV